MKKRISLSSTWRRVSAKDKAILWGRAAARCCFPTCKMVLIAPSTRRDTAAMFGQAGHINAHSPLGPRFIRVAHRENLDVYENLILLCGNHHAIVDKQAVSYPADTLRTWKKEHEAWVLRVTAPQQYQPTRWKVVIQEDSPRIDIRSTSQALLPDAPNGRPIHIRCNKNDLHWGRAVAHQAGQIGSMMRLLPPDDRRVAIFSLTRIPLAVHLGFILGDRCRARLFQYHRNQKSWSWPSEVGTAGRIRPIRFSGRFRKDGPISIRVSISAEVSMADVTAALGQPTMDVHIKVDKPSIFWLTSASQFNLLATTFIDVLTRIRTLNANNENGIHLFYAGPTGGAITLGQYYNTRMNPPLHLYEYDGFKNPKYRPALVLKAN